MTILALALSISGSSASQGGVASSGAAGVTAPSAVPGAAGGVPRVSAPEKCAAHRAVRFYSARIREHAAKMGAAVPFRAALQAAVNPDLPGRCPRYLARVLKRKAAAWRARAERYLTLRDFDVRPGYSGWRLAVDEVQRPYPGTKAWLLSCSASEGGWGRWVRHGGGPYYPGLERQDISGGWAQFKPGTFAGFYRHAVDDVRSRGFRVERLEALPDGWLSPLSQALAAAWGRVNGLAYHWVGRGC